MYKPPVHTVLFTSDFDNPVMVADTLVAATCGDCIPQQEVHFLVPDWNDLVTICKMVEP